MVFARLLSKLRLRRRRPGFHSAFGGLWTDRPRAPELLAGRLDQGAVSAAEADTLAAWIDHGFAILPGAVAPEVIDRLNADVEQAWARLDPAVQVEVGGAYSPLRPELRGPRAKLVDFYVHSQAAREAAFAAPIRRFLRMVFEREILLFQSLSFEYGSEQEIHQDTAYVVVVPPMEFAAAWIALEDIQPSSGELAYYPGSHRLEEFLFSSGSRNWNRQRDGLEAKARYEAHLHDAARARGLRLETFRPRKGDVLMWSADLAHGGSPVAAREGPAPTRRSFVCHYCPRGAEPYYYAYRPRQRVQTEFEDGCRYSSSNYPPVGGGS